jgi:putative ABC transport system permease protein
VEDRLLAYWSAAFAGLALALAAIGLFALLSCYVAGRRSDIGIRMALGADRAGIRRLVLRQIVPMMATAIVAGLAAAIAAGRLLASIAYGLVPYDPRLLAFGVAALIAVAIPAAWIPARRAASLDPLEALRQD